MNNEQLVATHFPNDVANHVLTIRHEDGIYRHLTFVAPNTGIAHFNITTWPGHLATSGDMGSFTFCRLEDMFEFFRSGPEVNVGYWSGKLVALDRNCAHNGREYSPAIARAWIEEQFAEWIADLDPDDQDDQGTMAALREDRNEILGCAGHEETLRDALTGYSRGDEYRFCDVWEESWYELDYHLLWTLHAIRWGIQQYDAITGGVKA